MKLKGLKHKREFVGLYNWEMQTVLTFHVLDPGGYYVIWVLFPYSNCASLSRVSLTPWKCFVHEMGKK